MTEAAQKQEIVHREPEPARPVSIFDVIQNAALRPDVDIDKMERLYAMHERELARQAEAEFNEAFAEAQAEMRPVVTNKSNDQTRSKYANLKAIADAIDPIIAKHGFGKSFGQGDSPKEGHYRVTMTLTHRSGHSREFFADVPADATGMKGVANKTATHAFGSTMSYGRRYLKLLAFDIATGDDDDGQAAGGIDNSPISEEQFRALRKLLEDTGRSEDKLCAYYKIERLPDLPARLYDNARASILAADRTARLQAEQAAREKDDA